MKTFEEHVIDSGYMLSDREHDIASWFFNLGLTSPKPNTPMIAENNTAQAAKLALKLIAHHLGVYNVNQSVLDRLDADITITDEGIMIVPTKDPVTVGTELVSELGLTFTRKLNEDSYSYSWVSELNGVPVIILANEINDLTGTLAPF